MFRFFLSVIAHCYFSRASRNGRSWAVRTGRVVPEGVCAPRVATSVQTPVRSRLPVRTAGGDGKPGVHTPVVTRSAMYTVGPCALEGSFQKDCAHCRNGGILTVHIGGDRSGEARSQICGPSTPQAGQVVSIAPQAYAKCRRAILGTSPARSALQRNGKSVRRLGKQPRAVHERQRVLVEHGAFPSASRICRSLSASIGAYARCAR